MRPNHSCSFNSLLLVILSHRKPCECLHADENVEAGGSVVCRGEMAWVIMLQPTRVMHAVKLLMIRFWPCSCFWNYRLWWRTIKFAKKISNSRKFAKKISNSHWKHGNHEKFEGRRVSSCSISILYFFCNFLQCQALLQEPPRLWQALMSLPWLHWQWPSWLSEGKE